MKLIRMEIVLPNQGFHLFDGDQVMADTDQENNLKITVTDENGDFIRNDHGAKPYTTGGDMIGDK
jgi:hypothetical protein